MRRTIHLQAQTAKIGIKFVITRKVVPGDSSKNDPESISAKKESVQRSAKKTFPISTPSQNFTSE